MMILGFLKKMKRECNRLNKYDYILMSSDFSIERIKQTFKNHKIDLKTTFVETGYAKLDYLIKNKTKIDKDSILIAPTGIKGFPDLTMKPFIEKIIKNLLHSTKFKVILRPHPSDRENVFFQEIKKKFEKKTNFEYDISDNYLNVYLKIKNYDHRSIRNGLYFCVSKFISCNIFFIL